MSEYNKIMVGLGLTALPWTLTDSIEIIDLEFSNSVCPVMAPYPLRSSSAAGGLNYDDMPMFCGGLDDFTKPIIGCKEYRNGFWVPNETFSMEKNKSGNSRFSPDNVGDGRIFFLGGADNKVKLRLQCT